MSDSTPQPPIPVICDYCRAEANAGDDPFTEIRDLLAFDPVPRRTHVNNWTAEHQRAFIAALAMTGSPRQAARALGRHAFGAEQLKAAKGGRSFAAAWDAALELYRERELFRIRDNLAGLARQQEERDRGGLAASHLRALPPPAAGGADSGDARPIHPDCDYDPEWHSDDYPEYWEGKLRIRQRMTAARRLLLASICDDPDRRAAWEALVGPVDWDRARRLEAQDDEPFHDDPYAAEGRCPRMRDPDMLLAAEAGYLADFTGGYDAMETIRQQVAEALLENPPRDGEGDRSPEASGGGGPAPGNAPPDSTPDGPLPSSRP